MGDVQDFTAQEIFTAGCILERILTVRERPAPGKVSAMASRLAENDLDGQGRYEKRYRDAQRWCAAEKGNGRQGHLNDWKQRTWWSPEAWGASWNEKRWEHPEPECHQVIIRAVGHVS